MTNFAIFRRFRLILGVFNASAEGASEKFRAFYRETAYDVIFFKFQGGGHSPPPAPPLVTPMQVDYTILPFLQTDLWRLSTERLFQLPVVVITANDWKSYGRFPSNFMMVTGESSVQPQLRRHAVHDSLPSVPQLHPPERA